MAYHFVNTQSAAEPLPTGKVEKIVTNSQVQVDGKKLFARRCCLISRADGKRIE